MDKYAELAKTIVDFSIEVEAGEKVLIDLKDVPERMGIALMKAIRAKDAQVFLQLENSQLQRSWVDGASDEAMELVSKLELERMEAMDAYIGLRGSQNIFEFSDIPGEKMKRFMKAFKPVHDQRVNHTRWCVLRWPHPSMAQQARMSTEAFEDFFFQVCTLDYSLMVQGMDALKELMDKTDRVTIKAPNVDLKFSIKDIPAIACYGTYNLPDGEVFTAPIKESVEGHIRYNTPSVYQGHAFDWVELFFEKGKIIKARSDNQKALDEILDSDPGARYIGEFALGLNPLILEPMRDILFDEKIAGSFHFTPGQAYDEADNGNRSQVHWDLVSIQRPEYGGGEISFDDKLIRKDGLFVPKSLTPLNPQNLI